MGGFGGGSLERPRQWLKRPVGLPASYWECRAAHRRQACPEEAQGPSWGNPLGGRFGHENVRGALCR